MRHIDTFGMPPSTEKDMQGNVASPAELASPSEQGRLQCLFTIASLEGLVGIALPAPSAANTSLGAIDARVRALEARKSVAAPPPVAEQTQATIAWRICRVRLLILDDFTMEPVFNVSSVMTMCPRGGDDRVTLRELRDVVASIPTSKTIMATQFTTFIAHEAWLPEISPTWSPRSGDGADEAELSEEKTLDEYDVDLARSAVSSSSKAHDYELEMLALVIQQLAHHVGKRSQIAHVIKLDLDSLYDCAMNTALNVEYWSTAAVRHPIGPLGSPPMQRRATATAAPGLSLTRRRPFGVGTPPVLVTPAKRPKVRKLGGRGGHSTKAATTTRGRRRRASSVSTDSSLGSDSVVSDDSVELPKWRYAPVRWIKALFCQPSKVTDDDSSSMSSA